MALVTIALAADGRGWVDGTEVRAGSLDEARAVALAAAGRIAAQHHRPVPVAATDPDGRVWHFWVGTDGTVLDGSQERQAKADPDAGHLPAHLRSEVQEIRAAAEAGRAPSALLLVLDLQSRVETEYGPDHPYALRTTELRAHTTLLSGSPAEACNLYLESARGWHRIGSSAYGGAAQRAFALWMTADIDLGRSVWLGENLAEVLNLRTVGTEEARYEVLRRIDDLRSGEMEKSPAPGHVVGQTREPGTARGVAQ